MVGSICGIQESLYGADNGADSCATDKEGHTAAGLGKKYGHGDIIGTSFVPVWLPRRSNRFVRGTFSFCLCPPVADCHRSLIRRKIQAERLP
jgi:hypothetical protein